MLGWTDCCRELAERQSVVGVAAHRDQPKDQAAKHRSSEWFWRWIWKSVVSGGGVGPKGRGPKIHERCFR